MESSTKKVPKQARVGPRTPVVLTMEYFFDKHISNKGRAAPDLGVICAGTRLEVYRALPYSRGRLAWRVLPNRGEIAWTCTPANICAFGGWFYVFSGISYHE